MADRSLYIHQTTNPNHPHYGLWVVNMPAKGYLHKDGVFRPLCDLERKDESGNYTGLYTTEEIGGDNMPKQKDQLKPEHLHTFERVVDEVQASIVLAGGRKFTNEELEAMPFGELLAMIIPNKIDVIIHPNCDSWRKRPAML